MKKLYFACGVCDWKGTPANIEDVMTERLDPFQEFYDHEAEEHPDGAYAILEEV